MELKGSFTKTQKRLSSHRSKTRKGRTFGFLLLGWRQTGKEGAFRTSFSCSGNRRLPKRSASEEERLRLRPKNQKGRRESDGIAMEEARGRVTEMRIGSVCLSEKRAEGGGVSWETRRRSRR